MKHSANADFWDAYNALPPLIQARADKKFALLKVNPAHPSLHFKQVGPYYSARVSDNYRALALKDGNDFVWFWIGPHDNYERLFKRP